jgi:hypothetical protein
MSSNRSLRYRFASGIFLMLAIPAVISSPGRAQLTTPNVSEAVVANSDTNGLNSPGAAAVGPNGDLFIVDTENNRLLEEPWNSTSKTYGAQTVLTTNLVQRRRRGGRCKWQCLHCRYGEQSRHRYFVEPKYRQLRFRGYSGQRSTESQWRGGDSHWQRLHCRYRK